MLLICQFVNVDLGNLNDITVTVFILKDNSSPWWRIGDAYLLMKPMHVHLFWSKVTKGIGSFLTVFLSKILILNKN